MGPGRRASGRGWRDKPRALTEGMNKVLNNSEIEIPDPILVQLLLASFNTSLGLHREEATNLGVHGAKGPVLPDKVPAYCRGTLTGSQYHHLQLEVTEQERDQRSSE